MLEMLAPLVAAAALAVPASAKNKRLMTVDDLSQLKTVGPPAIARRCP